jgi:hypothetical protein
MLFLRLVREVEMTDDELIEQSAGLLPVYCDGFGAFRKINGVFRCIGYVLDSGANLNLIVSLAGADQAQLDIHRVLHEESMKSIRLWSGTELAH